MAINPSDSSFCFIKSVVTGQEAETSAPWWLPEAVATTSPLQNLPAATAHKGDWLAGAIQLTAPAAPANTLLPGSENMNTKFPTF